MSPFVQAQICDVLTERIFSDLNRAFSRSSINNHNGYHISEFAIVPSDEMDQQRNKSPVIYNDHKLALESWCLPRLFKFATQRLIVHRNQWLDRGQFNLLDEYSRVVILMCPDFTTAWNVRRQLLIDNYLTARDEMEFIELVVTRKPKSDDIFSYRQWLLNIIIRVEHNSKDSQIKDSTLEQELQFCRTASSLYKRNYYAWSYATWIITSLCFKRIPLLLREMCASRRWIESNISDYSCFHYRQILLKTIIDHCGYDDCSEIDDDINVPQMIKQLFNDDLDMIDELLRMYPLQESLLLHRRSLRVLAMTRTRHYFTDTEWSKWIERDLNFQDSLLQANSSCDSNKLKSLCRRISGDAPGSNQCNKFGPCPH